MGNASESFLSGGGPASAKFPNIGDGIEGVIKVEPTVEQQRDITTGEPKVWADGNPQMQMVITLTTDQRDPEDEDDDGVRRLFVKGNMRKAVQEAVIKAGRKQLDVGGKLAVAYVANGEKKNPAFSAPKLYKAVYTPPNGAEAAAAFLGAAAGSAAQPAAQQAAADPLAGLSDEARKALEELGLAK